MHEEVTRALRRTHRVTSDHLELALAVLMGTRVYGRTRRVRIPLQSFTQEGQDISSSIQQGANFPQDYFSWLLPPVISLINNITLFPITSLLCPRSPGKISCRCAR